MQVLQHVFIIILCCVALGKGASWLVDAAGRLARRFGVSELVIGLTVVAFGSSAPEFAVTVSAAITGNADISVGNIIGSNIFNIGFILGGCAMVTAISTRPSMVWRDGGVLLGATILLATMLYNHSLSRFEGIVLFALLAAYLFFLFYKREPMTDDGIPVGPGTWKDGLLLLVGLVLIIISGRFLVSSAIELAEIFGLSDLIIALTVVAAGTSMPEFVISLVALVKKHHGMSAGNLIGSNIFNTLGVLGVAGVIRPLSIDPSAVTSMYLLILLTVMVILFMRTAWRLSRIQGAILFIVSLSIWFYLCSNSIGHRPAG